MATLKELEEIIEKQQSQINKLLELNNDIPVKVVNEKDPYDTNRLVTVIHMDDLVDGLTTTIKGDSEYKFCKIGDKFRIRLIELEKIMASYKKFFQRGYLVIADKDINEYFSLDKIEFITIDMFKSIFKLSIEELEKIYKAVCPSHQDMILRHWFNEYERGSNIEYKNYGKLAILNQCSDNKLQSLIDDLNQRNYFKKDK